MSEHQPPAGTPEYLEGGLGRPLPPSTSDEEPTGARRRSRRAWWIGGGVVALLGVGAGAWAALNFFQQGAQPAEALPSATVAYLSVDLDPAGGQKIDAFRTLDKFPAFRDEVGIDSVGELRHRLGNEIVSQSGCDNLDYDQDIDPWLGDRAAVALVDLPGAEPDSVVVVQVKDDAKARDGLSLLNSCATDTTGQTAGFVVKNGWAVLADDQGYADKVADATAHGSLADDATYQKWTKAVGEAGVVNAYASPDAGRLLAQKVRGFFAGNAIMLPGTVGSSTAVPGTLSTAPADDQSDPFTEALSGFKGGAATLRFTGDGLELAMAGDGSSSQLQDLTGTTGGELVRRLPADTAAALGVSLPPGWLGKRLDAASRMFGAGMGGDDLTRELEQGTGLKVPDDIETLLGSGVAVSMGKDFDFEAAENSDTGAGLPVGVTVKGDPAAIEQVLDKIRAKAGDVPFLGSDHSGELEAIGPRPEYRERLLAGGDLGDDGTFTSVVPDAANASSVLYLNVDAIEPALTKLAAGDSKDLANLTPLRSIGLSTWTDDGITRFSFKVSTN
jgi:hypothetical protein